AGSTSVRSSHRYTLGWLRYASMASMSASRTGRSSRRSVRRGRAGALVTRNCYQPYPGEAIEFRDPAAPVRREDPNPYDREWNRWPTGCRPTTAGVSTSSGDTHMTAPGTSEVEAPADGVTLTTGAAAKVKS